MGISCLQNLPDDIIHRIIVHHLLGDPTTTNKTALQFGILSKDLWSAVQRRPTLLFEDNNDPRSQQELAYMVSTLNKHNAHLKTFTIVRGSYCYFLPIFNDCSSFDRCIELAATNNQGLINLNLSMKRSYVLPQAVFQVKSLVQLDLVDCHLRPVESLITWPNLKQLHLLYVEFGEGVFENIIRGCPSIHILKIRYCRFNTATFHIRVPNLGNLRQLGIRLKDSQTFEVDANLLQILECLDCDHTISHRFMHVDFGKYEYHKLRMLTLYKPNAFSHDFLTNMEHQFPRLEELSIVEPRIDIKRINISSSSLKKINLKECALEEATFDVPNILVFVYQHWSDDVPNLSFAGNSNGWISDITFKRKSEYDNQTQWFLKLMEFLAALKSPLTSISVYYKALSATKFYIKAHPRTPADSVSFPGCTVKHLNITTVYYDDPEWYHKPFPAWAASTLIELINGIFLICRPQRITLMDWHECEFPKLLYDNLMGYTIINGSNFRHSMWNVSEINVRDNTDASWHRALKQPQVNDRDKVVNLFRFAHQITLKQPQVNDRDIVWSEFTVFFELEHFSRP